MTFIEIYTLFIFFLASFVHGVVGFAFALIATPLLAIAIPFKEAIALTIIPTIWVNIVSIFAPKVSLNFLKEYIAFFIFIILGSIAGTYLLFFIDTQLFAFILVFLIWAYLYVDFNKDKFALQKPQGVLWQVAIGFFAGLAAGVGNIMSPIVLIYFLSLKLEKLNIIILSNLAFLAAKVVQLSIFIKLLHLNFKFYLLTAIILLISSLGLKLGNIIREHQFISANYNLIVKIFIFIISIVFLIKTMALWNHFV